MAFADHPQRYEVANELPARPFPALSVPGTVAYLALARPQNAAGRDREADLAQLVALLDRHATPHPHPQPGATHYFGRVGRVVQRLCEIETCKAMSLLGFAAARIFSYGFSARLRGCRSWPFAKDPAKRIAGFRS
ncbi:MAG: hypothetical protein CSA70_05495 [Rhodobacterales bacterium]|nr:MAG: hypothetical protein CSA70_05495 [Rhodobacterales bacterium]